MTGGWCALPGDMVAAQRDAEAARLRKRLRAAQRALRDARAELARRPAVDDDGEGPLTAEEVRHLHAQFTKSPPDRPCAICGAGHPGPCQTCGGLHARACPRVRSVAYERHGNEVMIREVTYWPDGKWDKDGIYFPESLPPLPGEA